jgi:hypothetical protein
MMMGNASSEWPLTHERRDIEASLSRAFITLIGWDKMFAEAWTEDDMHNLDAKLIGRGHD